MISLLKRFLTNKNGATAVEFALIALPFMMMIFGIMEISRIVWIRNGVEYAAKETARYASMETNLSDGQYQGFAAQKLTDFRLPSTSLGISTSTYTSGGVNFVQVDVTYTIETMLNNFLPFADFSYNRTIRKPLVE